MVKRAGLSNKIRFEVFKRDKFTCNWCGKKAPEVVLNVDHIHPVVKGGTNEMLNLITSCFECNNGKRDKTIDDNSVMERQRNQLELLEERRAQLKLMFDWKKSLENLDDDTIDMIVDYINTKISPGHYVAEQGKVDISDWLKKNPLENILDAIDTSARQYLKYINNELDAESIGIFFKKIGGILVVEKMPPINKKLAYIKGIARNRFNFFDETKASIILGNYVSALKQHWTDEKIVEDLESEVIDLTKKSKHWSEWTTTLENWISSIDKWQIDEVISPEDNNLVSSRVEYSFEELNDAIDRSLSDQEDYLLTIDYIGKIFPNFSSRDFRSVIGSCIIDYIEYRKTFDLLNVADYDLNKGEIIDYIHETPLKDFFKFDTGKSIENLGILMNLEGVIDDLLINVFSCCTYPLLRDMSEDYTKIMTELHLSKLNKIYP